MGDFFGIILFFTGIFFLFLILSKITNKSLGYKNKGAFANPDDLDFIYESGRKLVDKKYKEFKEIEKKYLNEYNKHNRAFDKALYNKSFESYNMRRKGTSENYIAQILDDKYDPFLLDCSRQKKIIKDEFEKLTGKKLNVKK